MTFTRVFDIVGAGAGLLVFAPVMALVIIGLLARPSSNSRNRDRQIQYSPGRTA